ncbi:MAG: peptidoglycan-binding protein [Alphaproteobacteria bacterium]|nr:peptidoglycan-binding protein [Alphaproteobacteria bacterium]
MFEFQSLFSGPGRRPAAEDDDQRFPAFQAAWRQGTDATTLFGPKPFELKGSVGTSGADNFRPDVAKVETFLNRTGHYQPLTEDGPGGYHSDSLDGAIKGFQKENGLQVDGLLKPNGPTIGALGERLGGAGEASTAGTLDYRPEDTREPKSGPNDPDTEIMEIPGWNPNLPPIRVPVPKIKWPEPRLDPPYDATALDADPFPGHTISEMGAKDHDSWAAQLPRDSDPGQTARMLKGAIAEYGDQGRADVADLLGRFHQIDPDKAEGLRTLLKDDHGEDVPFRVAPRGEGYREPTDDEKLAKAPKAPFGSAQGADRWAAGNMAEVLLGKGDYADAVKHFSTDNSATMPYLAAVHESMRDKDPMAAMKFATQMQKAGLAMAADAPEQPTPPTTPAPTPVTNPPETTTPVPTPEPTPEMSPAPSPTPQPPHEPPTTTPEPTQPPTTEPPKPPAGSTASHRTAKSIEEILKDAKANGGWLAIGGDKQINDGTECVALVKAVVPELRNVSTRDWRQGEVIPGDGAPSLEPGTAIASGWDKDGKYPSNRSGNHAMIYMGPDPDVPGNVIVIDQYGPRDGRNGERSRKGRPAEKRSVSPGELHGYSVIRRK